MSSAECRRGFLRREHKSEHGQRTLKHSLRTYREIIFYFKNATVETGIEFRTYSSVETTLQLTQAIRWYNTNNNNNNPMAQ